MGKCAACARFMWDERGAADDQLCNLCNYYYYSYFWRRRRSSATTINNWPTSMKQTQPTRWCGNVMHAWSITHIRTATAHVRNQNWRIRVASLALSGPKPNQTKSSKIKQGNWPTKNPLTQIASSTSIRVCVCPLLRVPLNLCRVHLVSGFVPFFARLEIRFLFSVCSQRSCFISCKFVKFQNTRAHVRAAFPLIPQLLLSSSLFASGSAQCCSIRLSARCHVFYVCFFFPLATSRCS